MDDLSFEVKKGEVFALLGHNGAGKSTTIDLILGLKIPDEGTAQILENVSNRAKNFFCSPDVILFCLLMPLVVFALITMITGNKAAADSGLTYLQSAFVSLSTVGICCSAFMSIFHKGSYRNFSESYETVLKYIEDNGYKIAGEIRESYIDGIWNKEDESEWLSEIQVPVTKISEINFS